MTEREVEAGPLYEGRKWIESQIPEGFHLLSEKVVSDVKWGTKRTIEVEADSLYEARKLIKSQIPEGFHLLSEKVVSDVKRGTEEAIAETTEAAYEKAQNEIPNNADIIEKKVLTPPGSRVVTVEAFDEQSAKEQVKSQIVRPEKIRGLKLAIVGRKGLLGIGKKPNQYEAEIFQQAVVRIAYKTKARIAATIDINVKPLILDLKKDDENTRSASMEALIGIGASAVKPLIAVLGDRDRSVRVSAAEILAQIGKPAVEPLIAALKEKDWSVKVSAAEILAQIGDARAMKPLIDALELTIRIRSQPDPLITSLKEATIEALGQIGGAQAVEPLIKAYKNSGQNMREGNKSWTEWDDLLRKKIIDVVGQIGKPAVEPLIVVLKDTKRNPAVAQGVAVEALGRIGDPRAVEPLIAALTDYGFHQEEAAIEALERIGAPAIEPLTTVLRSGRLRGNQGRIAVLLVKHGVSVTDPCLRKTIQELKRQASLKDQEDYFDDDWNRITGRSYKGERNEAKAILRKLGLD